MWGCRHACLNFVVLLYCWAHESSGSAASRRTSVSSPLPRVYSHSGSFFVRASNGSELAFVPVGANYIRLNASQGTTPPLPVYHSTFSPKIANATLWSLQLDRMQRDGFNVVRVFVDPGDGLRSDGVAGAPSSSEATLDDAYLNNLAQFVDSAAARSIYTMITLNGLPVSGGWATAAAQGADCASCAYPNSLYLHSGHVDAKAKFASQLLLGLQHRLPEQNGLSSLFGLSLENEAAYMSAQGPFCSTNGTVVTADGLEYNLSSPASRQQAADANAVHWARTLTLAAHSVDPLLLVAVGLFTNQAVGKGPPDGLSPVPTGADSRYPLRLASLSHFWPLATGTSTRVFLDQHIYSVGTNFSLQDDLSSIEWSARNRGVAVVMGEFGAFKSHFPTATGAASGLRALQVQSCSAGFSGWLLWTLDTWEQPRLWNMFETASIDGGDRAVWSATNAPIELALANRSNPCQ